MQQRIETALKPPFTSTPSPVTSQWPSRRPDSLVGARWHVFTPATADLARIRCYFNSLSMESRRLRLQTTCTEVPEGVVQLYSADGGRRRTASIVACSSAPGRLLGEALLAGHADGLCADIALSVADTNRRRGLGKQLLQNLIENATQRGFRRLLADTLRENEPFIALAAAAGFQAQRHPDDARQLRMTLALPTAVPARIPPKSTQNHPVFSMYGMPAIPSMHSTAGRTPAF